MTSILSAPTNKNGVLSLWRGTLPSVIRTGLGSALYFSGLNGLRRYLATVPTFQQKYRNGTPMNTKRSSTLPQLSKTANLVSGAGARAAAGWVLMPITVMKVRYESSLYSYKSLIGAGTEIWRREGMRGFFKGAGATAARDAPYAGLYVVVYEEAKRGLGSIAGGGAGEGMTSSRAGAINFTASVLAAGIATTATNPFDAVKTRLQLKPENYTNMVSAARDMVKLEGWRSLMDGLGLRMGRKAASSALAWTVYEELIRRAETRFGDAL